MNKILALSVVVVTFIGIQGCSVISKDSHKNFDSTILQCNSCHSASASTPGNAPSLAGMNNEYFIEQLKNFRNNKRGAGTLSPTIKEMSRQVKALQDEELSDIANYYENLPIFNSTETVAGDTNKGKSLYEANCQGCHSSFVGRFFTNSPKISHLKGSYILDQLTLFAANKRHFQDENKHKNKMIEVSKRFNKKELSDITAYIKSNQSTNQ